MSFDRPIWCCDCPDLIACSRGNITNVINYNGSAICRQFEGVCRRLTLVIFDWNKSPVKESLRHTATTFLTHILEGGAEGPTGPDEEGRLAHRLSVQMMHRQ
jgi:hypothetical protein